MRLLAPQIQRVCQFFRVKKKTLTCAIRHPEKSGRLSSALLVHIPQKKKKQVANYAKQQHFHPGAVTM